MQPKRNPPAVDAPTHDDGARPRAAPGEDAGAVPRARAPPCSASRPRARRGRRRHEQPACCAARRRRAPARSETRTSSTRGDVGRQPVALEDVQRRERQPAAASSAPALPHEAARHQSRAWRSTAPRSRRSAAADERQRLELWAHAERRRLDRLAGDQRPERERRGEQPMSTGAWTKPSGSQLPPAAARAAGRRKCITSSGKL